MSDSERGAGSEPPRRLARRGIVLVLLAPILAFVVLHVMTGLTGKTGCEVDGTCTFGFPVTFYFARGWSGTEVRRGAFLLDYALAALPVVATLGVWSLPKYRRAVFLGLVLVAVLVIALVGSDQPHAFSFWNQTGPRAYGEIIFGR